MDWSGVVGGERLAVCGARHLLLCELLVFSPLGGQFCVEGGEGEAGADVLCAADKAAHALVLGEGRRGVKVGERRQRGEESRDKT